MELKNIDMKIVAFVFALFIFIVLATGLVGATEEKRKRPVCYPTPTIAVTPTSTPRITPTVEPTPIIEITPSPTPIIEVEPTSTPSATPAPTDKPKDPELRQGSDNNGGTSACTALYVSVYPLNTHVVRNGSKSVVKWIPTQGNEVNIFYKENGQSGWTHSVADQKNNGSIEVNGLNPKLGYTYGLQQKQNCGGGVIAVIVDPPAKNKIFRVSYYIK